MKKILFVLLASAFIYATVNKDSVMTYAPTDEGKLDIEFKNMIGNTKIELNTGSYVNAVGEKFTVTLLNYYISNIKLTSTDGKEYAVPKDKSYFLIKEENPSQKITLENIPVGDYSQISFTIGIDSLKCASPIAERTGVLDPASAGAGMYWNWNSGYIFVKMEGACDVATSRDKKFRYHIGGFGGYESQTLNNIKNVQLKIPVAKVKKDQSEPSRINIKCDASKVMNGSTNVSIAEKSTVMFAPFSVKIADNYADMFSVDNVHNN